MSEGFFAKFKKSVSDSFAEANVEAAYRKAHRNFSLYTGEGVFAIVKNLYGELAEDGKSALVYGEQDVPYGSVLVLEPRDKDTELPKFFYAVGIEKNPTLTVSVAVKKDDAVETVVRPATLIHLDADVKEVKVVKVGEKYFLRPQAPDVKAK